VILSTKNVFVELPKLTNAGRNRFSHEAVAVDQLEQLDSMVGAENKTLQP
jgi:hypothetical protein